MKRGLLIVAVFLLAGAVVNVAVAWGCGFSFYAGTGFKVVTRSIVERVTFDWWGEDPPNGFAIRSSHGIRLTPMAGVEIAHATRVHEKLLTERLSRLRTGWPSLSLSRVSWTRDHVSTTRRQHFAKWLIFRPVWPGFANNTLFYAAFLWLLIGGPFAMRRFIRIRRGLCPKCTYPMGESAVCTECGRELPKRAGVVAT